MGCVYAYAVQAQFSLTSLSYTQDFNTLANTGTSSTLPAGWFLSETGTGANTLYAAGSGTGTTGDTYSFGAVNAVDRAFGALQSGSVVPTIGFYFTNNTGSTITALSIQYTGEQWRMGAAGRVDQLDFQYSSNATALNNGTWTDANTLDFIAPITAGIVGELDGNLAANRTVVSSLLSGLSIAAGSSFFIRWSDLNATGSDDGLGIDDLTINVTTSGPLPVNYYRSLQTGDWNVATNWESSPDNTTWTTASSSPASSDNAITIRSGHEITISSSASADQCMVESGGTVILNAGITFDINDGLGTDLSIAGILVLNGSQPTGTGTIVVQNGGTVRVDDNTTPNQADDFASLNTRVSFLTGSVFDWNTTLSPSSAGITYFVAGQIPIFRFSKTPAVRFGGNSPTIINGLLDLQADVTLQFNGDKTFVNGIVGSGSLIPYVAATGTFTGNIVINGTTAQLGGSGSISLPASPSVLQIGSGTTVTMTSSKTINGDVSILANSYVDADTYDLTVSGNISGGNTNYVRTASTGSLILKNVTTSRTFPVGHSLYNPLVIDNGSGHDWTVRVNDGVVADPPYGTTGAVLLTWHILPAQNPPTSGADITFQFDNALQVGAQFNTAPYNSPDNVIAWHRRNGYWLAAGVPMPLTNAGGNTRRVTVFGLTQFSPYALSRVSLPLPVSLISFKANRIDAHSIKCEWMTAQACRQGVSFVIEGSLDGISFDELDRMPGSVVGTKHVRNVNLVNERMRFVRLRMLEPDGRVQTGPVVELKSLERGLTIERVWVAGGGVRAEVYSPVHAPIRWEVVDVQGRLVHAGSTQLQAGVQIVTINNLLSVGIHHLIIHSAQGSLSRPFLNPKL